VPKLIISQFSVALIFKASFFFKEIILLSIKNDFIKYLLNCKKKKVTAKQPYTLKKCWVV